MKNGICLSSFRKSVRRKLKRITNKRDRQQAKKENEVSLKKSI